MSVRLIAVIAVIALGIAAAIAWDIFCVRDLIRVIRRGSVTYPSGHGRPFA